MSSRRDALRGLSYESAAHAGLWLDKFMRTQSREGDDVDTKRILVGETAQIAAAKPVLDVYRKSFARWQRTLESLPGTELRSATARGRVVIGMGGESVLETAVTLHRSYGLPYIPGSALKGLAAAYARQHLDDAWAKPSKPYDPRDLERNTPTPYEILFGSTSTAGYVTFHDALWDPDSGREGRSLYPDVLTVHHQAYYNKGGKQPPADWDSPVPVPFLSGTGTFLIALSGASAWRDRAFDILARALDELGIGAKTSSGYGRMDLKSPPPPASLVRSTSGTAASAGQSPGVTLQSTRTVPSVGAIFTGKVLERDDAKIAMSVPGHPPEAVLATMAVGENTPWRPGDLARVEVTSVEERGGRTILTVRRAPKEKKS